MRKIQSWIDLYICIGICSVRKYFIAFWSKQFSVDLWQKVILCFLYASFHVNFRILQQHWQVSAILLHITWFSLVHHLLLPFFIWSPYFSRSPFPYLGSHNTLFKNYSFFLQMCINSTVISSQFTIFYIVPCLFNVLYMRLQFSSNQRRISSV